MRWVLSSCVLVAGLITAPWAHAEATRPNILLITSEDNGPELGCYGEPYVQTPRLDALARDGVRFDRAFVSQAGCSQSRSSILTGLYPHQNGQIGLATWGFKMYRDDTPNLPRSLKEAGYRTGIIGKLHINPASAFPFDTHEIKTANFERGKMFRYTKLAGEFIGASDQPFFLMVNYPDAHRPFLTQVKNKPAKPLTGADVKPLAYMGIDHPELRQQTADYYNCMNRLDTLVGELLDTLRDSGKADNTLVIYLGDHGADLLRGKRTSYESGVRIPQIAAWANGAKAGQVRQELVSTIDLMPTLLDAAGAKTPTGLPGRSFLPLLKGETPAWREYLFTEFHLHGAWNYYPQRTVRNDRYKLIHNLMPDTPCPEIPFALGRYFKELDEGFAGTSGPVFHAYQRMKHPPEFELYDLKSDPFEFVDLSADPAHQRVLKELKQELDAWRQQTADPLLNPDNLKRLTAEIEACLKLDNPKKNNPGWSYTEYFFESP
jgi:N-sulfoglucosamine sulfohydrolase